MRLFNTLSIKLASSGDVASHLIAINVDPDAPQFSEDGGVTFPYITVAFAWQSCHINGATRAKAGLARSIEELVDFARGFHLSE